jgi:adenylate cyclase
VKPHRRIFLREAAMGAGLLTAAWYLFYLLGVGSTMAYLEEGPFLDYVTGPAIHVEILVLGLGLGLLLALVGHLFDGTDLRLLPFGRIILLKSLLYLGGLGVAAVATNLLFLAFLFSLTELKEIWGIMSPSLLAGLLGWSVVSIVGVNFLTEVRRKVGPGSLWALLTGRYHRPREEERVFLFLDLKGSTRIAEALGNVRYSEFLRRVYHDLTEIVLAHEAEIYQYVGDEVVLTWRVGKAPAEIRSLRAFFAFREKLEGKRARYMGSFGVFPEFRGGVEAGMVTATEVGDIKRDIAFHGDPLNTAARLLELCREYGRSVLVSGRVREAIRADPSLATDLHGEVTLRGKREPVVVYGVTPSE